MKYFLFLNKHLFWITTLLILLSTPVLKSQNTVTSINNGVWSDPTTWDIGVPSTGDNVIILHFVTLDIIDTINDITIKGITTCNDSLYVTGVLEIGNHLILNTPLTLVNDSINNGRIGKCKKNKTITGDIIWQKWISRCDGWGMYGSPFNNPLVDLGFIHTGFPGTSWPTFWVNTYFYDETIPDVDLNIGWVVPNNVNDILNRGQGFFLFDSSSSVTNDARVIELIGITDLTENFNYNITYSGLDSSVNNGWNMVSNPWLGTINWDAKGWKKRNIEDAIWVLDVCTKNYTSYINGVGVNGGSEFISSGQAFWVKSIISNPSLKSKSKVIVNDNSQLKRLGTSKVTKITLNSDEIAFVVDTGSTNFYDYTYDAHKFITQSSKLYTKIDTNIYSINTIKDKDTTSLYVKGSGQLNFNGQSVFYQDILTGIVYDSGINPTYTFINNIIGYNHRFNIILKNTITDIQYNVTNIDNELIRSINLLGQEVNDDYIGIIIEQYSDGSIKKLIRFY